MNFAEWIGLHKNDCFRYWIKKEIFTPYEIDSKFTDQSYLQSVTCDWGYIVDWFALPNGEVMIALADTPEGTYKEYHNLKQLELALSKRDGEEVYEK